jgi:hypothetical protein
MLLNLLGECRVDTGAGALLLCQFVCAHNNEATVRFFGHRHWRQCRLDTTVEVAADAVLRFLKLNFVFRTIYGVDDFGSPPLAAELACKYRMPQVRCVVRTRVMCQAGRARAADAATLWCGCLCVDLCHKYILYLYLYFCVRAPLWVVARVCALLRDIPTPRDDDI